MKVLGLSFLRNGRLYPQGNIPGTHFCWRLRLLQGHSVAGRIMSMKNTSDTIGNRTRDLFPLTGDYYTFVFSLNDLFTPSQRVTPNLKKGGLIFRKNLLSRNEKKKFEAATLGRIQISTATFEFHFHCSDFCCLLYTGCIKMIGAVWKVIIFTSMVKRLINTSRNERVTLPVYDTCLQMFLFFGLQRKDCLTRSTLSSDTRGRPALFPLQRHPVVWNCWYQRLMLLGDGGTLLNCRRYASWTETTDSCFTNCSTQNAFCSGVAIIALLRHRLREKKGVGLRMRTKLENLLFRSTWET